MRFETTVTAMSCHRVTRGNKRTNGNMRNYQNELYPNIHVQHILPYGVPALRAGPPGGWGGT